MNWEAIFLLMSAGSASGVWGAAPVGAAPQTSRAARGDAEATERTAVMAMIVDVKEGILKG
jgi:hypothetical protein